MGGYAHKIKNFIKKHYHELKYFWKYAILAKFHFIKYRSKKVILFRLDLIGDCTMFTSAASAIRKFYKDREMTIICLESSRPVFERLGIFDNVISLDFKPEAINWEILKKILNQIRKEKYDLLLQPQISKFPLVDVLAAAVKCNRRISIEPFLSNGNSSPAWIKITKFLYDKFIPYPRGIVSEFDYYGTFVRAVCDPNYKTTMPYLPYGPQKFIKEDYYVIYPGGSLIHKYWALDKYAKVAEYIYEKTGLRGVILGTEKERWAVEDLKKHLNTIVSFSIIDLTGKTSIYDVIDIIGNSKFIVSNDTSGVHIAAATGTPSIAIMGGWHFKRFLPYSIEDVRPNDKLPLVAYTEMPCYNCNWNWNIVGEKNPKCLELLKNGLPSACVVEVRLEQVLELVDRLLKEECI